MRSRPWFHCKWILMRCIMSQLLGAIPGMTVALKKYGRFINNRNTWMSLKLQRRNHRGSTRLRSLFGVESFLGESIRIQVNTKTASKKKAFDQEDEAVAWFIHQIVILSFLTKCSQHSRRKSKSKIRTSLGLIKLI